jgi:hypothetical protein
MPCFILLVLLVAAAKIVAVKGIRPARLPSFGLVVSDCYDLIEVEFL